MRSRLKHLLKLSNPARDCITMTSYPRPSTNQSRHSYSNNNNNSNNNNERFSPRNQPNHGSLHSSNYRSYHSQKGRPFNTHSNRRIAQFPQQRNRSFHQIASNNQVPHEDPLAQYSFNEVTHEQIRALDINSTVADDLLMPGKAVCYLTQIITVAENQFRNVGSIEFDAKSVGGFWVGFLTINFPQKKTFTCKHKNKKECKNICSLAAIHHLKANNAVDSRLKLNIDTSVTNSFIDNSRGTVVLTPLTMCIKQQMMSFISKFEEYVSNLVEYQIHNAKCKYETVDIGGIEGKHSAVLEGLDPDEGIVAVDSHDRSETQVMSAGPIDLFTSKQYVIPEARSKVHAFSVLKKVLSERNKRCQIDDNFYDLLRAQERLPIRNLKENIVEALRNNRTIVIAGDTGCGKSTQVPQFILENLVADDSNANTYANIAITQPRRISAISLAERVALELGEPSAGYTVGHNVRFDSKPPARELNIMTFFTTGMLLKKLQRNPDLKGVSHLIVDEVHERDCTTDFLLILIKRILTRRRDLRVIFMSASMDASLFARYFDNCPIISVSGRCYPVKEVYLNEIYQESRIKPSIYMESSMNESEERTRKLDLNLLTNLIQHIDETRDQGAILCFMPGWKEMKALQKELEICRSRNQLRILLVHSKLPISEQRLIFSKTDHKERKVILATNIAETSITINDVRYVIDTGLCNSIDYDPELNMSTFGTRWISRANAKQRSGRAGRTSPGECFKLYTKSDESYFRDFPFPELLRIPLESVIMEAKCHCPTEKAMSFLSQAVQHPSISAIHNAIDELMLLGVLDSQENLTTLGKRISDFSTHPRLSVSLVVSTALRCLYPVLNASAILSSTQDPFLTILTDKSQIRKTKERLCSEALGSREPINYISDHLAFGTLLAQYDNAAMSKHEHEYFLQENNLNRTAMINIQDCRNLYAKMMISSKFVTPYEWYSFDSLPNRNMNECELVIASLTHSFYPKVVRVIRGLVKGGRMYPTKAAPTDTQTNARVRFASDSIVRNISLGKKLNSLAKEEGGESDEDSDYLSMSDVAEDRRPNFITYLNSRVDQDSGQIVIRDGSVVPALTLLLFGGREISMQENKTRASELNTIVDSTVNITLDRHNLLSFRVSRDDATVIQEWRNVWHKYLDWFIHTKNTGEPFDKNDSIIAGTMNEFLELNKKLYQSISYHN